MTSHHIYEEARAPAVLIGAASSLGSGVTSRGEMAAQNAVHPQHAAVLSEYTKLDRWQACHRSLVRALIKLEDECHLNMGRMLEVNATESFGRLQGEHTLWRRLCLPSMTAM